MGSGGLPGVPQKMTKTDSMKQYERNNVVLKMQNEMKKKTAMRRDSQLNRIAKESRKTLMMYAKNRNVLEMIEKDLKENTRDDSDSDDQVVIQQQQQTYQTYSNTEGS